jgi:hypothetical protein
MYRKKGCYNPDFTVFVTVLLTRLFNRIANNYQQEMSWIDIDEKV